MIYTLTTNPSVDYYIYLKDKLKEGINRPTKYDFVAGGKGVNVSKILSNLKQKNICVLLAGGFSGDYIKYQLSKDENIEVLLIPIEDNSRINVKIRCNKNEIDLNTIGPEVTKEKQNELVSVFSKIKDGDYVCISGSLQKGMIETVIRIAENVNKNKGKLILDVPNMSYDEIVSCKPYLIKPNDEEIKHILKTDISFPELIYEIKEKITEKGINCLLSLGEKGSCYISKDRIILAESPKVTVINTVGAGDSLLAAFVYMLENNNSIEECLKFATATGSATVKKATLPTKDDIIKLVNKVIIKDL
ncbi:MAG: hexose kinase [Erysipelotrichia bacterium]|jgi:1-phosphofructokinase|nr:hexose kinase [Erysipelotrichia bacterium]